MGRDLIAGLVSQFRRRLWYAINKVYDVPITQDLVDKLPPKTRDGIVHFVASKDLTGVKRRCMHCKHFDIEYAQRMINENPVFSKVMQNRTLGQLAASANGDFRKDADGMTDEVKAIIGADERLTYDRFGWCQLHTEMRHRRDCCGFWK